MPAVLENDPPEPLVPTMDRALSAAAALKLVGSEPVWKPALPGLGTNSAVCRVLTLAESGMNAPKVDSNASERLVMYKSSSDCVPISEPAWDSTMPGLFAMLDKISSPPYPTIRVRAASLSSLTPWLQAGSAISGTGESKGSEEAKALRRCALLSLAQDVAES
jgi:hypothetical protein